jgi:glutamate dehydrogenase
MNTDAVDNSAGVDTSDHEVNLKILLASRPGLHRSERDELLVSLTDDIARLVLADNISQNELLTVAAGQAFSMLPVHERMIHAYAVQNILDIDLESLPREEELNHRRAHRQGLTKPELSVLMAYTKIQLTKELLEGSAIDGEWATEALFEYFPRGIHETWRAEILAHPLRREIIATVLSNRVVNHAGITAVYRLQEETGVDAETGVLALLASLQVSQAQQVMSDIHGAGLPWNSRLPLLFEIRRYLDRTARWFIAVRGNRLDIERDVEYYRRAIQAIRGLIKEHLQGAELDRWLRQTTEFEALGASHSLASLVAGLLDEYAALDLSELARGSQYDLERWSERYFQLSNIVGGDLILNAITELARENRWQTMARASMRADIYSVLAALTEKVLLSSLTVTEWQALHAGLLARISSVVEYVATARPADIAAISVALKMLRELVNQTDAN